MDNFIASVSPAEIIVSLYHPSMFPLYVKFKPVLDSVFIKTLDEVTKKLYLHLSEIQKGLTVEGFALHCESLGFSNSIKNNFIELFKKYMELTDDDYKALEKRAKNFVCHHSLQNIIAGYNEDGEVEAVIKKIKELETSSISSDFSDETLFSDKLFGEINVEEALNTYLAGVIKSSFGIINVSSGIGGYIKGQMVVFAAPTKCFTGDTKLMTLDGKCRTLEDLYKSKETNILVYSIAPNGQRKITIASYVQLSKYTKEIAEIRIGAATIRCTPDHPFCTTNGIIKAKDLTKDTKILATKGTCQITDITIKSLEEKIPVYGVVNAGPYHNYAISLGNNKGIFVKNTGKSMLSMAEAVNFIKQDLHVLYAAFGDLKDIDFLYRMCSQINHHPMPYTCTPQALAGEVLLALGKVPQLKTHLRRHLLAPDKFTAEQYVNLIKNKTNADGQTYYDWADVIIVDYDSNLKSDADSMYAKGENIYQTLYQLVGSDKLVIVLAQTTKVSWDSEIIDMSEIGESSRKQQIIDVLLTVSHPVAYNKQNHVGKINLCATRRGTPMITPYFRDIDGNFHEITEETYEIIKSSREPKTFIKDIYKYNDYISGNYDVMDSNLDHPSFVDNSQKATQKDFLPPVEEEHSFLDDGNTYGDQWAF